MSDLISPSEPRIGAEIADTSYFCWTPAIVGAIIAAALSFVLLSFAAAIGLAVVSPSATWCDTSWALSLLGGLWLLLTALASFGLGGYVSGRLRVGWASGSAHEVEFRDGIHGIAAWGLAIIIGAFLALAVTRGARLEMTSPTAATAEPLLAFELDKLFRSDSNPVEGDKDQELRAQATRIITSGLEHSSVAPEDRAYLAQLVQTRTGIDRSAAEARVDQAFARSRDAITKARTAAVVLAFMIGASLLIGAAAAWLAATAGGKHRDEAVDHIFWRRWEVDRLFFIR